MKGFYLHVIVLLLEVFTLELSESLPGPVTSRRFKKQIANLYNVTNFSPKLSKSSLALGTEVNFGRMFKEAVLTTARLSQARENIIYKDCCQPLMLQKNSRSGIYSLQGPPKQMGYCDMEDDGGGWMVLMRRSKP